MTLVAKNLKAKKNRYLAIGGSAIIESSDEKFDEITDVFVFYGSNPELNFLHDAINIKDKEEEIKYQFQSAKTASEFYYLCLDIQKN
jgi:hypothetical protein